MQGISTKEDFARRLKEADIEVIYRINPEGRLYGITFIDHTTRTVFNGSRMGKAFSANVFNELFNNPDADRERLIPQPEQAPSRQEREARAEERQEGAEYRQQENQSHQQSEFSDSLIDTSALGAVDIFSVLMEDDHTHEYIDPAFRFGRKKRKSAGADYNIIRYRTRSLILTVTIMQNEDDLRGLAKVTDFMRAISFLFLAIHIYWFCYGWLHEMG